MGSNCSLNPKILTCDIKYHASDFKNYAPLSIL
jgi:hypothetical protein